VSAFAGAVLDPLDRGDEIVVTGVGLRAAPTVLCGTSLCGYGSTQIVVSNVSALDPQPDPDLLVA